MQTWPKRISTSSTGVENLVKNTTHKAVFNNTIKNNSSKEAPNMTRQNITDDSSTPLLITKIMDGIKNFVTTEDASVRPSEATIQFCDEMPPDLGNYIINI